MTKYYHGGYVIGKMILPPSVTGAVSTAEFGNTETRENRVYVTTSIPDAALFALGKRGYVYECKPVGKLEIDPDCNETGISYCCKRAKIVRILQWKEVSEHLKFAIDEEMEKEDGRVRATNA